jgi:hypothetical protein
MDRAFREAVGAARNRAASSATASAPKSTNCADRLIAAWLLAVRSATSSNSARQANQTMFDPGGILAVVLQQAAICALLVILREPESIP